MFFDKYNNIVSIDIKNRDIGFNENFKGIAFSEDQIYNNKEVLSRLPYCNIQKLIRVDFTDSSIGNEVKIDVRCDTDEFVFVVQEGYLELMNDKHLNLEDFISNVSPRLQLLKHKQVDDKNVVTINKSDINYVLNYNSDDLKYLNNILPKINSRLKYLVNRSIDKLKKKLFIVVGKFKDVVFKKEDILGLNRIEYNGEEIQKSSDLEKKKKPPIVIVHGLASSIGLPYCDLITHLQNKYTVYGFDYLTINQSIHYSGTLLDRYISQLSENYNGDPIPIIAHSMGGLVSRNAMIKHKSLINYIIMAGTPNNGSKLASLPLLTRILLMLFNFLPIKVKDFYDLMHRRCEGLEDLSNKNNFIDHLNESDHFNYQRKYFSLAGIKFLRNSDGIVWLNDMISIKDISMPHIRGDKWWHVSYFKKGNFESQIDEAVTYLTS